MCIENEINRQCVKENCAKIAYKQKKTKVEDFKILFVVSTLNFGRRTCLAHDVDFFHTFLCIVTGILAIISSGYLINLYYMLRDRFTVNNLRNVIY